MLILDIGCGQIMHEHRDRNFPGHRMVGIDAWDFSRCYPKGEFFQHDVRDLLPFANETFDRVWSHHMLEHLPPFHPYIGRPEYIGPADYLIFVMNEIWRVLKVGGEAHLVVPWNGHTNAWRSPLHYRFFDEFSFQWWDWRANQSDHETGGLWAKFEQQGKLVDNTHVYGTLKACQWASHEERVASLGPFCKDWKALAAPTNPVAL